MSDLERLKVEMDLATLTSSYSDQISAAWEACHEGQGSAWDFIDWAKDVDLVTADEQAVWRKAMIIRNANIAADFRVVLEDITACSDQLRPIVEDLPARMKKLGLAGDDSV